MNGLLSSGNGTTGTYIGSKSALGKFFKRRYFHKKLGATSSGSQKQSLDHSSSDVQQKENDNISIQHAQAAGSQNCKFDSDAKPSQIPRLATAPPLRIHGSMHQMTLQQLQQEQHQQQQQQSNEQMPLLNLRRFAMLPLKRKSRLDSSAEKLLSDSHSSAPSSPLIVTRRHGERQFDLESDQYQSDISQSAPSSPSRDYYVPPIEEEFTLQSVFGPRYNRKKTGDKVLEEKEPLIGPFLSSNDSPRKDEQRRRRPLFLSELLQRLGIQTLEERLEANGIRTLHNFRSIDSEVLQRLGITDVEQRAKILTAVELLSDDEGGDNCCPLTRDSGCFVSEVVSGETVDHHNLHSKQQAIGATKVAAPTTSINVTDSKPTKKTRIKLPSSTMKVLCQHPQIENHRPLTAESYGNNPSTLPNMINTTEKNEIDSSITHHHHHQYHHHMAVISPVQVQPVSAPPARKLSPIVFRSTSQPGGHSTTTSSPVRYTGGSGSRQPRLPPAGQLSGLPHKNGNEESAFAACITSTASTNCAPTRPAMVAVNNANPNLPLMLVVPAKRTQTSNGVSGNSLNQLLEHFVQEKLRTEMIDLAKEPYTNQSGQSGVPLRLIQRYASELDKDLRQVALALEHARLSRVQDLGLVQPISSLTEILTDHFLNLDQLRMDSLSAFLHSAGLPMYVATLNTRSIRHVEDLCLIGDCELLNLGLPHNHLQLLRKALHALPLPAACLQQNQRQLLQHHYKQKQIQQQKQEQQQQQQQQLQQHLQQQQQQQQQQMQQQQQKQYHIQHLQHQQQLQEKQNNQQGYLTTNQKAVPLPQIQHQKQVPQQRRSSQQQQVQQFGKSNSMLKDKV